MTELLDDIKITPVKKLKEEIVPQADTQQQSLAIDKSINKERSRISKADKGPAPFSKWIMPPQPQAYIKCRRHDFF